MQRCRALSTCTDERASSRGLGGGLVVATTTLPASSIDGYIVGDFPLVSPQPLFDVPALIPLLLDHGNP
jgi:hypothetical protein